jgi:hypothetical protein
MCLDLRYKVSGSDLKIAVCCPKHIVAIYICIYVCISYQILLNIVNV